MKDREAHERIEAICTEFLKRANGRQYFSGNRDFVIVNPQLLSEEVDRFLAEHSVDPHSSPLAYAFARMRILFRRCTEIGIDRAFEEEQVKQYFRDFLGNGEFGANELLVKQNPFLLTEFAKEVIAAMVAGQSSPDTRELMGRAAKLLSRCSEIGVHEAFEEHCKGSPPNNEDRQTTKLMNLLQRLIYTDYTEMCDIIRTHPELLDPATDALLDQTNDERVRKILKPIKTLLQKCRDEGIEKALEPPPERMEQALFAIVQEFLLAETETEKRRIIDSNAVLLTPETGAVLKAILISTRLDRAGRDWCEWHVNLLEACRERGIDRAFRQFAKPQPQDRSPGFEEIVKMSGSLRSQPELIPDFINACQSLLEGDKSNKHPHHFAGVNMALGQAYLELAETSGSDYWRLAEKHLSVALEGCDKEGEPRLYANINMELARTFATSPLGDRHSNQVRALQYNFAALEAWKKEHEVELAAGVMLNLGNLFVELLDAEAYPAAESAVAHCREALHMLREAGRDTTAALHLLGAALLARSKSNDVRESIQCFEAALEGSPEGRSRAIYLLSLSVALLRQDAGKKGASVGTALRYLREAEILTTVDEDRHLFAKIKRLLARTLARQDSKLHHKSIIDHYQTALEVLTTAQYQRELLNVLTEFGRFYCACGEWSQASALLSKAVETFRLEFKQGISQVTKQRNIDFQHDLFADAAYAAAMAGDNLKAVQMLDEGKAKLLGENVERHAARPNGIPDDVWFDYLRASYLIGQLEWEAAHNLVRYENLAEDFQRLRNSFTDAIARVQNFDGTFLNSSPFEIIGKYLVETGAVAITFCCTSYGSLGFILGGDNGMTIEAVRIPTVTRSEVTNLIVEGVDDDGNPRGGWLGTMAPHIQDRQSESLANWIDQINPTLKFVSERLLMPIVDRLGADVQRLLFIPSHELYLLPLHAAPLTGKKESLVDRYEISYAPSLELLAHSILHDARKDMTRAFSVMTYQTEQTNNDTGEFILVVTNPELDTDLGFAEYEGEGVARYFAAAKVLHGPEANRESVVRNMAKACVAHFACHGTFDWVNARKSGLYLANGALTVEELLLGEITLRMEKQENGENAFLCLPIDYSSLHLVVISACESGVSNVIKGSPSEYLAVASGFLLAGVPTVVSTLWAVPDLSTALFMEKAYSELAKGASAPAAFRVAALWLKTVTARELVELCSSHDEAGPFARLVHSDLKSRTWRRFVAMGDNEVPYAHPYYWGAFVISGYAGSAKIHQGRNTQ